MDRPPGRFGATPVTTVFAVVGEHRDDPDRLLLLGDDGHYYGHHLPDGPTALVEPDERWTLDEAALSWDDVNP